MPNELDAGAVEAAWAAIVALREWPGVVPPEIISAMTVRKTDIAAAIAACLAAADRAAPPERHDAPGVSELVTWLDEQIAVQLELLPSVRNAGMELTVNTRISTLSRVRDHLLGVDDYPRLELALTGQPDAGDAGGDDD